MFNAIKQYVSAVIEANRLNTDQVQENWALHRRLTSF